MDCRALIGLLSLARTVHMTTVLCINRQKETHQQTLVPNGYCHFFLSIVHLSHQMYKRISLGHHFPLKNPNLLGFKFEMQFLKEIFFNIMQRVKAQLLSVMLILIFLHFWFHYRVRKSSCASLCDSHSQYISIVYNKLLPARHTSGVPTAVD